MKARVYNHTVVEINGLGQYLWTSFVLGFEVNLRVKGLSRRCQC